MARSKNRDTRETNVFSRLRLRFPSPPGLNLKSAFTSRVTNYLREIEDRRTFHPEGYARPARSFNDSRHRLTIYRTPKTSVYLKGGYQSPFGVKKLFDTLPTGIQFRTPYKVLICVRRKIRKEVIFAKNQAGRGGQRSPHYSEYSTVRC